MISQITVRRAPGAMRSQGILSANGRFYRCLLGKNGISIQKQEGDWTTPTGQFRLLFGFYRKDRMRIPNSALPLYPTGHKDAWCDDPGHPSYNRKVTLPFHASHETLMRDDTLYDIVLVMDHNYSRRIRGRGSAVFFHLTAEKPYTAGCVAISKEAMLTILPGLSTKTVMRIAP